MYYEIKDKRRIRGDIKFFTGEYADIYYSENIQDMLAPDDLETAILISILTDARATDDEVAGHEDFLGNRGWWGEELLGTSIGSKLWLLKYETNPAKRLLNLESYTKQALLWLKEQAGVTDITTEVGTVRKNVTFVQTTLQFKNNSTIKFVFYYDHYNGAIGGQE